MKRNLHECKNAYKELMKSSKVFINFRGLHCFRCTLSCLLDTSRNSLEALPILLETPPRLLHTSIVWLDTLRFVGHFTGLVGGFADFVRDFIALVGGFDSLVENFPVCWTPHGIGWILCRFCWGPRRVCWTLR